MHGNDTKTIVWTMSYPDPSGSLVSGLVARRHSGEMELYSYGYFLRGTIYFSGIISKYKLGRLEEGISVACNTEMV